MQIGGGNTILDEAILTFYREKRTLMLTDVSLMLAFLGGVSVLPFVVVALSFYLYAILKMRLWDIYFLLLSVFGALLINIIAKDIIERPRPSQWGAVVLEHGFSFPSGHTMTNIALSFALFILLRGSWRRWALLWGLLVGVSRNYLGVHYPSDVLVGALWSIAWVTLVFVTLPKKAERGLECQL